MPICDDQRGRGNLGWGWSDTREGGERGWMERWEHLIIIFNLSIIWASDHHLSIIFMVEIVNLGRLSLLLWSLVSIYVDQNDTKVHQILTLIYNIKAWVLEMYQSNLLFHSRVEWIPSEENVFPGKRGPITNKAAPHSLPPSSLPPTPVSERRITASNQGHVRTQKKFRSSSVREDQGSRRMSTPLKIKTGRFLCTLETLEPVKKHIDLETLYCWGFCSRQKSIDSRWNSRGRFDIR